MIWWLFVAHLAAIVCAAVAGRVSMRAALFTAAIAPAATSVWAVVALASGASPTVNELVWVPGLDLGIRFRTDALALMMTLLVAGIGALVFVYAAGYFPSTADAAVRFPASLLAFSTSMLGLVWADSVWTLFIFWELTSVTSFLLVGHRNTDASVRAAARRALLITGGGGLALLAGLIVLANETGSSSLTGIEPISGTSATVSAVLVMIGAATKSAQFPFHVWLPGAMAAPTPVSAYLHSATMVKAGVLLIAVVGPAFVGLAAWTWLGLAFGITSMLWGGIGALRHRDAKLILAWGTVSQLGLLVTLLALGSPKAVFAAVSMLFAHALFKAALFLVVGEIDVRTGTRDIHELGGLSTSMPVTFGVALLAGLSMAGAPPLLGFTAKEAAIEAVLGLSGPEQWVGSAAVIGGSILTVAYTVRFLIGVFGPGPRTKVGAARPLMTWPAVVLGLSGVIGYVAIRATNQIVRPAATELNSKSDVYALIQWPGLKAAFAVSMVVLACGITLGIVVARQPNRAIPAPFGATLADQIIDHTLRFAPRITARIQHGSLPVYLVTMAGVVSVTALPFAADFSTDHLVWWDDPVQGALAGAVLVTAFAAAFVGSRLGAALALGGVGIGVTGLFVFHGAPDLALTQLLVETVVVVGFVLGLGHLARRFPPVDTTWRTVRIAVSAAGGLAVAVALAAAGANPTGGAPVETLTARSVDDGGGKNVVNVILTDVRALDTLGEVVVLATVAVGILALARIRTQEDAA